MAINWICEHNKPRYVLQAMRDIPLDLKGIYAGLFQKINEDRRPYKRELAKRAISWLLGAQAQLSTKEFLKAMSSAYEDYNDTVEIADVISSCHHLMIHNAATDVIEFGHFSVLEYTQEDRKDDYGQFSIHNTIAYLCLNALWQSARVEDQGLESKPIRRYVDSLAETSNRHPLEMPLYEGE
jgi:hypothetical protein